jgi:hypothetical protein
MRKYSAETECSHHHGGWELLISEHAVPSPHPQYSTSLVAKNPLTREER